MRKKRIFPGEKQIFFESVKVDLARLRKELLKGEVTFVFWFADPKILSFRMANRVAQPEKKNEIYMQMENVPTCSAVDGWGLKRLRRLHR